MLTEHHLAQDMDGKMSVTVSELSGKQTSLLSRMAGVERGSERQFGEMWSELERVKTTSKDTQNLLTSVQRDMANHLHQLDSSCAAHNRRMAVADEDRSHLVGHHKVRLQILLLITCLCVVF